MLADRKRWVSLGRAAKLLNMHYTTLLRHLEDSDAARFQVLERRSASGRRLRYLAVSEIRQAMGEVPVFSDLLRTREGGGGNATELPPDTSE